MRTFSTCRGCGELLMTAIGTEAVNTNVHENKCVVTRPTARETYSQQLNEALLILDDIGFGVADQPDSDAKLKAMRELDAQESIIDDLKRKIADLDNQPPRFLDAAVQYAKWGWPVFPLGYLSKHPAIPKDKGGNGVKDATTDVDRIKRYWQKNPTHNIGIATGYAFDVLDIDTPKKEGDPDGRDVLPKILASNDIPDAHGVVITANGGFHYYLEPAGIGNRAGILPGVDIRGKGGYVVAPPSRLPDGRRWFWSIPVSPTLITQP